MLAKWFKTSVQPRLDRVGGCGLQPLRCETPASNQFCRPGCDERQVGMPEEASGTSKVWPGATETYYSVDAGVPAVGLA